jgi:hypothetical protein
MILQLWFFLLGLSHSAIAQSEMIPLNKESWTVLSFNKIPANQVEFVKEGLLVQVNKSAGPVVFKLKEPKMVSSFSLKGTFKGNKAVEGKDFDEDSILRFGLVAAGTQTLSGFKKLFAADWVKKLFALAPEGMGLDKIYFYNLTNRKALLNKSRQHPKSELFFESIAQVLEKDGPIALNSRLATPLKVAAIWLSIDGDDTKSEFSTLISNIQLN